MRECSALIDELQTLRASMLALEQELAPWRKSIAPQHQASAGNLTHYLAMRRVDLRRLQDRLARIGVSSLGRSETHVLANLDKVLGILHVLAGRPWQPHQLDEPAGFSLGSARLADHATALFGPPPARRRVRIMVTLPTEAAHDRAMVDGLVAAGLDIVRINCAHDSATEWQAMARHVRAAATAADRTVAVLMDLGGPKLRTGPLEPGPRVLKVKPERDAFGAVESPALLTLRATSAHAPAVEPAAGVGVDPAWLEQLQVDDTIALTDARGSERRLTVVHCAPGVARVSTRQTCYLTPQTVLRLMRDGVELAATVSIEVAARPGVLHLNRGDRIHLLKSGMGQESRPASGRSPQRPTVIACTLPEALDAVRKGERVWFDDGRIGAVVRRELANGVELEVTVARDGGEKLAADKGINLPDTQLNLPALTAKDLEDLTVVAVTADLVGLSFAQSGDDVRHLLAHLATLNAAQLGIILKIETQRGFAHLPEMLFAALGAHAAGVMIARGDLAVECGYERMAEVQEEILWACEAAHLPVVWATQVLETLAKTGLPSRAEITDAAMGVRAECVMLNKGPHILEAIRTLDDILQRMQAHQTKKRPLLRALQAWQSPLTLPPV